jgi:cell division protein FtsB
MGAKNLNLNYIKILKALFLLLVALTIFMILFFPNYSKLKRLREANRRLSSRIEQLKKEIDSLEKDKVEVDKHFYERIAREKLGVAKKGEVVVDIRQ